VTSGHLAFVFPAAHRRGGVERVVHELASFAGHVQPGDVSFVGYTLEPAIDGVTHVRPDDGGRGVPALLRRRAALRTAVHGQRPSVAVSAGANCPPADLLLVGSVHRAWLAQHDRVTVRGRQVSGRVRRLHPWHATMLELERRYFTDGDYRWAVACSTQVKHDIQAHYGVGDDRIVVVPNGYSAAEFSVERRVPCREGMRAQLGHPDGALVLLLVANELHRKGLDTILEAMRTLDDRVRLDIVGRAPIDAYEPMIERLGLGGRVRWRGATDDVMRTMAAADVLVLPTRYEPFGLVVVEALAAGLPVVVSRCAGAADAVRHGDNGLLLDDPLDAEELNAALRLALDDATLAAWQSRTTRDLDRYRWDVIGPQILGLTTRIAADGRGRFRPR
jgi:glycosyltransferase involved in cell wall biosynthesis